MSEIKQINNTIKILGEYGEKAEIRAKEAAESVTALKTVLTDLQHLLKNLAPPTRQQAYMDKEIKEVCRLLEHGFTFTTTREAEFHLKHHSMLFKKMNTMQIGILLGKCGFRSGTKNGKRGFYLSSIKS